MGNITIAAIVQGFQGFLCPRCKSAVMAHDQQIQGRILPLPLHVSADLHKLPIPPLPQSRMFLLPFLCRKACRRPMHLPHESRTSYKIPCVILLQPFGRHGVFQQIKIAVPSKKRLSVLCCIKKRKGRKAIAVEAGFHLMGKKQVFPAAPCLLQFSQSHICFTNQPRAGTGTAVILQTVALPQDFPVCILHKILPPILLPEKFLCISLWRGGGKYERNGKRL